MRGGQANLEETMVYYRCAAPPHARGRTGGSGLLIHEGRWAYCPAGADDSAHQWTRTGGLPVRALRESGSFEDDGLQDALAVAETVCASLGRAIGVTTFRLEVSRPGIPLRIDFGERWPLLGRALLELELADSSGPVAHLFIGDHRRDDYDERERAIAHAIASISVPTLRRWILSQPR